MPRAGRGPGVPVGIVLAGGRSRRLGGGDKCLLPLAGRPILAHVIARARPQVAALALDANGDPARFAGFGLKVVADSIAGFAGPLAGVLAGLDWAAAEQPAATHLASFAGDAPVPAAATSSAGSARRWPTAHEIACAASSGGGSIPSSRSGRWRCARRSRQAVAVEGVRKVEQWRGASGWRWSSSPPRRSILSSTSIGPRTSPRPSGSPRWCRPDEATLRCLVAKLGGSAGRRRLRQREVLGAMSGTIEFRVLELLNARLCHELVSPIGAINNGVELLDDDDPDFVHDAIRLIGQSARKAGQRLQFYRFAYGTSTSSGASAAGNGGELAAGLLEGGKVRCDWPAEAVTLPVEWQRLACNMLVLAAEALPRGGAVLDPAAAWRRLGHRGERRKARAINLSPEMRAALDPGASVEQLTSRTVHAYFTARLALPARRRAGAGRGGPQRALFRAARVGAFSPDCEYRRHGAGFACKSNRWRRRDNAVRRACVAHGLLNHPYR